MCVKIYVHVFVIRYHFIIRLGLIVMSLQGFIFYSMI